MKEGQNMWCQNNKRKLKVTDQLACQTLCEADFGCVGVAWSDQTGMGTCYLCQDDILSQTGNNYWFYRRPQGNNELYYEY